MAPDQRQPLLRCTIQADAPIMALGAGELDAPIGSQLPFLLTTANCERLETTQEKARSAANEICTQKFQQEALCSVGPHRPS
jgi:hypothetical protein